LIKDLKEFTEEARHLFANSPRRTRYVLKYRKKDGEIVLKVTDDKKCLKFVTQHHADLRSIEKFTALYVMWSSTPVVTSVESLSLDTVDGPDTSRATKNESKRRRM